MSLVKLLHPAASTVRRLLGPAAGKVVEKCRKVTAISRSRANEYGRIFILGMAFAETHVEHTDSDPSIYAPTPSSRAQRAAEPKLADALQAIDASNLKAPSAIFCAASPLDGPRCHERCVGLKVDLHQLW